MAFDEMSRMAVWVKMQFVKDAGGSYGRVSREEIEFRVSKYADAADKELQLDPWDVPYRVEFRVEESGEKIPVEQIQIRVRSSGRDRIFDNRDDLDLGWYFHYR